MTNNTEAQMRAHGPRQYVTLTDFKIGVLLTRGHVAQIDPEDYEAVSAYTWHASVKKGGTYAATTVKHEGGKKSLSMHKLIMGAAWIDHKDGNGLNNTRANLRFASHSQNNSNKKPYGKNKASQYKGVKISPRWKEGCNQKKWAAEIKHNKKVYFLGTHHTEIEAAKAYDAKALELHGEFAFINFGDNNGN